MRVWGTALRRRFRGGAGGAAEPSLHQFSVSFGEHRRWRHPRVLASAGRPASRGLCGPNPADSQGEQTLQRHSLPGFHLHTPPSAYRCHRRKARWIASYPPAVWKEKAGGEIVPCVAMEAGCEAISVTTPTAERSQTPRVAPWLRAYRSCRGRFVPCCP